MDKTTKIMDKTQIEQALLTIASEIEQKLGTSKEVALIGIVTRGETIARRVMKLLAAKGFKVDFGIMDITLYRDDFAQKMHKAVVRGSTINFSLDDKHVILVDDVIFTGRTARSAINQIFDFGRPKKLELLCPIEIGFEGVRYEMPV